MDKLCERSSASNDMHGPGLLLTCFFSIQTFVKEAHCKCWQIRKSLAGQSVTCLILWCFICCDCKVDIPTSH